MNQMVNNIQVTLSEELKRNTSPKTNKAPLEPRHSLDWREDILYNNI